LPRMYERTIAVLCYVGALRVPLVALVLPEWAFTIPTGLLFAGLAWAYGRKRSPFLLHHGGAGFAWALQTNLLLAAGALVSKGLYYAWFYTGLYPLNWLWHFSGTGVRWAGALVSVITGLVMWKALRGDTTDALTVSR